MNKLINDFENLIKTNQNIELPVGYFYSSLAFCLTDAIFSINALYKSVENTKFHLGSKDIAIRRCDRIWGSGNYKLYTFDDFNNNNSFKEVE